MRRVISGTIAALVLIVAMVVPTLAHTATVTCDHITLGKVPVGVSAVLTPGPITISPPNSTTSINGTYEVPPGTYMITFSDGSVIHSKTVPACPTPSPSTPSSASPSTPPSSSPSASDSAAPSSVGTPAPSPSGSGGILGATATPRTTAPATDMALDPNSNGLGASLPLLVFILIGINIGLILILRTPARPYRRGRRD